MEMIKPPRSSSLFFLAANIDDITETPFLDLVTEGSWAVEDTAVEPDRGRTASVQVVGCPAPELFHELCQLKKR